MHMLNKSIIILLTFLWIPFSAQGENVSAQRFLAPRSFAADNFTYDLEARIRSDLEKANVDNFNSLSINIRYEEVPSVR